MENTTLFQLCFFDFFTVLNTEAEDMSLDVRTSWTSGAAAAVLLLLGPSTGAPSTGYFIQYWV